MRFGLQIETVGREDAFGRMLAVARLAEGLGFESVWYEDHFSLFDEERPGEPWPQLECMTTLATLAASTRRIEIGALVVGIPYRNPALLAKMWTTLDVISAGRAIAGLGAGWNEGEFKAYGYEFGSVGERMDALEDAVRIADKMMQESPATYHGKRHSIDGARNEPPPVQRPRPAILVGGNGEKRTLKIVAEHADMCNVYGSPDDVRRRFGALRRHCEDAGRSYEGITRTVNLWMLLARDEAERAEKRRRFPNAFSVDTPEEAIAGIRAFEAAGAQFAIVKILDAADLEPVLFFAEEVMPAFGDRAASRDHADPPEACP